MEKKSIKNLKVLSLAFLLVIGLASCGNQNSSEAGSQNTPNSSQNTQVSSSEKAESVIKELSAKESLVSVKIGDSLLLTSYYSLEGNAVLTAAQKACTYTSSDESIIKINNKKAEAVGVGEVTITVTSKADTTKTCTFDIKVSNVFIDRELSMIPSEDDFSKEWDDEKGTGEITTNSKITNFYYVRGINSKNWYLESDITIHEVSQGEEYPKIGLFARSVNSQDKETMVAFFINAEIGKENNVNWNKFGFCEAAPGSRWAWESGITDSLARHQDAAYEVSSPITYGTKFKLGVAREDNVFHVYVNEVYAYSHQLSSSLDVLYENGASLDSYAGFYHYNSKVTYSNYKFELDAAKYRPTNPNYITQFNVDENEAA